jgi:hypothetical protein
MGTMTTPISPSPILECFVRAVKEDFPKEQSAKIVSHQAEIDQTTSEGDHHRARRCALWAIEMADEKDRSHPRWKQIKELHQVWKDTWFALEFAGADALPGSQHGMVGKAEPLEDVRIEWTTNAVDVAKAIGEEAGWEHSSWEDLLVELIGIDAA